MYDGSSMLPRLSIVRYDPIVTAIRKAVFPAAGLGTRFLPATKAQPKEMLPIVDKPIIQYGVEEAVAAGIKQMIVVYAQQQVSVLALQRVADEQVSRYGIVKVARSDGRIHEVVDMVEKPEPGKAPSNLAILGRYVLKPSIFPILETTHEGVGGEIQLTDALRTMAQQEKMLGLEFEGTYYDVGTVSGFLKTSIAFALERPGLRDELLRYLGTLDGLKPPS